MLEIAHILFWVRQAFLHGLSLTFPFGWDRRYVLDT